GANRPRFLGGHQRRGSAAHPAVHLETADPPHAHQHHRPETGHCPPGHRSGKIRQLKNKEVAPSRSNFLFILLIGRLFIYSRTFPRARRRRRWLAANGAVVRPNTFFALPPLFVVWISNNASNAATATRTETEVSMTVREMSISQLKTGGPTATPKNRTLP